MSMNLLSEAQNPIFLSCLSLALVSHHENMCPPKSNFPTYGFICILMLAHNECNTRNRAI